MRELTENELKLFSSFERITGVMPSDCFSSDTTMLFIVDKRELGKAIGRGASNIKKLEKLFKKRVTIIGDGESAEELIRNFFGNIKIYRIEERNVMGEKNYLIFVDEKQRGIAVGPNGERIKMLKQLLKNRFNATAHIKAKRVIE